MYWTVISLVWSRVGREKVKSRKSSANDTLFGHNHRQLVIVHQELFLIRVHQYLEPVHRFLEGVVLIYCKDASDTDHFLASNSQ